MTTNQKNKCQVNFLGTRDYQEIYQLQKELVSRRTAGEIEDQLLIVEHPPVFTIGKSGGEDNILVSEEELEEKGIEVYEINRGGNITYHGPGQIVVYPIFDLNQYKKDLHWYLRQLEEVVIQLLAKYDIKAGRKKGLTGVWVGEEKIAAIGVAAKRWVTYHGVSFNYDLNLDHFDLIHPCGIEDKGIASLEELLSFLPTKEELHHSFIESFAQVFGFGVQLREVKKDES